MADRPDPMLKMLEAERLRKARPPSDVRREDLTRLALEREMQRSRESAAVVDIDVVERGVRERQEETLEKQVIAEDITRKTAPPRLVERRRARELAPVKEEKFATQAAEVEALEEQGYSKEDVAELVYGIEQPEHVGVPVEERVYGPEPVIIDGEAMMPAEARRRYRYPIFGVIAFGVLVSFGLVVAKNRRR